MSALFLSRRHTARWGWWGMAACLVLTLALAGGDAGFAAASGPVCPAVPAPVLLSPEDGAEVRYTWQDSNYFLNWAPVADSPGYYLRVWDAETHLLVVAEVIDGEGSDSYEVWDMAGSFTWNVIAMNPVDGCRPSQASETWAFTAAQNPPPAVPVNVQATDGTYSDRVIVTWEQPESDSLLEQWQVRRATEPDPEIAVEVAAVLEDTYIDKNATPGVIYYYWVEACSHADGCSELSEPDSGYVELPLLPPTNVRATDGTFADRIEIDWDLPDMGPPIDHWLVYRATLPDKEYAVQVDHSTNTHSISTDVTPGVTYYFWVQACGQDDTCSELSEPDAGYARVPSPPSVPVNVDATDGVYPAMIEINWEQPDGGEYPDHYLVYRSLTQDFASAVEVDYSSNTRSLSEDVAPGVLYYFWITACAESYDCSEPSEPDSGYAGSGPVVVLDLPLYLPYLSR